MRETQIRSSVAVGFSILYWKSVFGFWFLGFDSRVWVFFCVFFYSFLRSSPSNSMEAAASDGGNHNLNNDNINKISNSSEGLSRPKRQMKTPFQLETLEKAFACSFTNLSSSFFYFFFIIIIILPSRVLILLCFVDLISGDISIRVDEG